MDIFHKDQSVPLTDVQTAAVLEIKGAAEALYDILRKHGAIGERSDKARCINLAATNLEQSVMWAVKGVTSQQPNA